MEKLQAAIESARRQRGDAERQPAEKKSNPKARGAAGSSKGLWDSLPEVGLEADSLSHMRILSQSASAESAPFDVLRTKILYQMRQNGWRRLAVTSPMPQSGKSTTLVNLALAMRRQPELKTMVFDFDLRTPTVSEKLGLPTPPSIAPLLLGERSFADHGCRIGSNLALALSGVPESDPTRLLMADSTKDTLAEIEKTYEPDIMIFDLPSILIGDDARAFLQHVDCALILARADETRYGDFDSCEREVSEYTNVLGVVLNAYRHGEGFADAYDGGGS